MLANLCAFSYVCGCRTSFTPDFVFLSKIKVRPLCMHIYKLKLEIDKFCDN